MTHPPVTPPQRVVWCPGDNELSRRVVVGALVHVPRRLVDLDRVRIALTIKNDAFWQQRGLGIKTELEPVYELWRDTEATIGVPRHFFLATMVARGEFWRGGRVPPLGYLDRRRTSPKVKPIRHRLTLRNDMQREASKALSGTEVDKIISLSCGSGKTCVALHAASEGERFPLLIIVHTNALMDQWRANYDDDGKLTGGMKKFYGLRDDQIGRIQGPICDWRGKKVAIAMLNTLVQKEFEFDFYRYWRLVVTDETHRLGAATYQKAAAMFPGERWGLSATVDREDKMDTLFRMHMGEVVYEDLKQPLDPKVFFVNTGLSVDMNKFMVQRTGRVNLSQLQTHLAEHEKRNALISAWITKAYKKGRKILILGERLSQLHGMAESFQMRGFDAAVYVGSTKKDKRREALQHRLVFATQHIAKEGLDKATLDTLFITVPFGGEGRTRQSIGRILRTLDGKMDPVVCVFEDNISIISALARKMKRFTKKFGYIPIEVSADRAWKAMAKEST